MGTEDFGASAANLWKTMTYYIRYAVTDSKPIVLEEIEKGLQQINPAYEIDGDLLVFEDEEYGLIDISYPNVGLFASDLRLMQEFAEDKEQKESLLAELDTATGLIVIQALVGGDYEHALEVVYGMCEWLMKNRSGLLMDEGGYFYREYGVEIT